jgi:hypothetical protein
MTEQQTVKESAEQVRQLMAEVAILRAEKTSKKPTITSESSGIDADTPNLNKTKSQNNQKMLIS